MKTEYIKSHYYRLKEGLTELAEFLHLNPKKVWLQFEAMAKANPNSFIKYISWADDEWKKNVTNPVDKKQVLNYWKKTESHLYILTEVNHTKPQRALAKLIIRLAKKSGCKSILDFGCGVGDNCLDYQKAGLQTIGLEVKGQSFNFAAWRFKKRKLKIPLYNSIEKIKRVDCISCIEVFQHLSDPINMAKKMLKILPPRGQLFTTFRFANNYQPALRQHISLEKSFLKKLQKIGFEYVGRHYLWGKSGHEKFLYVLKKK